MRFTIVTPVIILLAIWIAGCAPRTLDLGSEAVKVGYYSSGVAKHCKFIGDVSIENVHGNLSLTSSRQERELDDLNYLKNEGNKLGANTVLVLRHDQVVSERQVPIKINRVMKRTRVTYDVEGKAYSCPPGVARSLDSGYFEHPKF